MWQFLKQKASDENKDPYDAFETQEITESLVRESIQNSLDAKLNLNDAVKVVFSYGRGTKTLSELYKENQIFHGLKKHIEAENSGILKKYWNKNEKVDYLVIEDFNTKGLNGDIDETEINGKLNPEKDHDFFYFWRNTNRSGKMDHHLGKWGLGKTVLTAASSLNTLFALTIRSEDKKCYLMGKAILKLHWIDKQQWKPYGYFSKTTVTDEDLALPYDMADENLIDGIFKIHREKEPGLSVIIPLPRTDLQDDGTALAKSVIREYPYAIVTNCLTTEINYEDGYGKTYNITSATIQDYANELLKDEKKLHNFISAASKIKSEPKTFKIFERSDCLKWDEIEIQDSLLEEMENYLNEKKSLKISIPINIETPEGKKECNFYVYFIMNNSDAREKCHYMRNGLEVKDAEKTLLSKGFTSIVDIDSAENEKNIPLVALLNKTENPAHTKWITNNWKQNERLKDYKNVREVVKYIKDAPHQILRKIEKTNPIIYKDIFKDIFSIQDPNFKNSNDGEKPNNEDGKNTPTTPPLIPPSKPTSLNITQINGKFSGFKIRKNSKNDKKIQKIYVNLAYNCSTGKPLNRWSKFDFQIQEKPIQIESNGLKITYAEGNKIKADIVDENFALSIIGFDKNKDLFIDTDEVE